MTTRRSLSTSARVRIFRDADGRCHICGQRITVSDRWDVEHVIPIAMGGADDDSNMAPSHMACHRAKTASDLGQIAKAKRQEARHLGVKKPTRWRKPPPGYGFDWSRRRYVRMT